MPLNAEVFIVSIAELCRLSVVTLTELKARLSMVVTDDPSRNKIFALTL